MQAAKSVLTAGVAAPVLLPLLPVVALAWAFSVVTPNATATIRS